MLGKIGDYYWIYMVSRQKPVKHDTRAGGRTFFYDL